MRNFVQNKTGKVVVNSYRICSEVGATDYIRGEGDQLIPLSTILPKNYLFPMNVQNWFRIDKLL